MDVIVLYLMIYWLYLKFSIKPCTKYFNFCRSTLVSGSPVQTISYDTTFNLGDFYLSVLIYRQTEFDPQPIMPLAFLLHERKLTATHNVFFQHLASVCPEINDAPNLLMVTDSEVAITSAITANFPELKRFLCWNHILQDAKRWLREHGVTSADEMKFYVDSLRSLFGEKTEQDYTKRSV